jgi:hypothetical protein
MATEAFVFACVPPITDARPTAAAERVISDRENIARGDSDDCLSGVLLAAGAATVVLEAFIARERGGGRLAAFAGHVPGDSAGRVEVAMLDSALRMPPL